MQKITVGGSPFYALEKFSFAAHLLATEPGDVKDRLVEAFYVLSAVSIRDLPKDLRAEWQSVRDDLSSSPARRPGEGRLLATLRYMRKKKAADIAARICNIKSRLDTHLREAD